MRISLRIVRVNPFTWWWEVYIGGLITAYALPVADFPLPMDVLSELRGNREKWNVMRRWSGHRDSKSERT